MSLFAAELQDRGTIVGFEFGFKGKKPKVSPLPLNQNHLIPVKVTLF
jgi:hypothetical protein